MRRGALLDSCFNSQPPEGGWSEPSLWYMIRFVSTHSRPKAAGFRLWANTVRANVSTHSRPKAAGGAGD